MGSHHKFSIGRVVNDVPPLSSQGGLEKVLENKGISLFSSVVYHHAMGDFQCVVVAIIPSSRVVKLKTTDNKDKVFIVRGEQAYNLEAIK
jgi:hypothetical protein